MNEVMLLSADVHLDANSLDGRNILITGADAVLGEAVAHAAAALGATVILLGAKERALEILYDALVESGAPQPALLPFDLPNADVGDYSGFAEILGAEFGVLHGIAHCHIDYGILSPLALYEIDTFDKIFATTFRAPYLLTRACFGLLGEAEDSQVIYTSIKAGRQGQAYWGAYAAASAAIENLCQIWADETENANRPRFNTLDIGAADIPARKRIYPGEAPDNLININVIANAFCYLLCANNEKSGKAFAIESPPAGRQGPV